MTEQDLVDHLWMLGVWTTRRDIELTFNLHNAEREIRAMAQRSAEIKSGSKGYIHADYITLKDRIDSLHRTRKQAVAMYQTYRRERDEVKRIQERERQLELGVV